MSDKKPASAGSIAVAPGEPKVKMVQRHPEFQESDAAAAQAESDANRFSGPNPYPAGSVRAKDWEYLKSMTK